MARKTDGEKIDDLEKIVATLVARLDIVRDEKASREWVAVIDERLSEFKRTVEEAGRRRWTLVPAIISIVGGFVGGIVSKLLLDRLTK